MPATVAHATPHRTVRALFPTERSDLRITWHAPENRFVVSLWRNDQCVATAPLTPTEAARLAAHIVTELGGRET